jgi:hypothetical protein
MNVVAITRARAITRWVVLAFALLGALALHWLSFRAGMTAGDMADHAQTLQHRSGIYSSVSVAVLMAGIAAFVMLKSLPRVSATAILYLAIALGALVYPWLKEFLDSDKCLDSGGRWNYALHECEK